MNWVLSCLLTAGLVEVFLRLPLAEKGTQFLTVSSKAARVVRSPAISDHWKELAMGAYAKTSFKLTAILAAMIGLVVVLAVAGIWLLDMVHPGFSEFIIGWTRLAVTLGFGIAWAAVRVRLRTGAAA